MHAKKCLWFKTEVKWCGRIISKEGIRFDPRSRDVLLQLSRPVTGGDLQQFLCALGWMRSSIPQFAKLVVPLQKLLESVYKKADGRTKQKAKRVPLSIIGWGQEEESCFEKVKHELQNSCTLAHLDNEKQLCLFTDASDQYWASVLTQIPPEDVQLEPQEQRHQPLAFHSGCFVRAGANWTTPEKEAFAIVESCIRLQHYLTRPNSFLLFTDHKNLTFIYNPYSSTGSMARHVAAKVQRWAMTLSSYNFEIEHIPGDDNVWADLMTRWGAPVQASGGRLSAVFQAPVAPYEDESFTWPTAKDVAISQKKYIKKEDISKLKKNPSGLLVNEQGSVWIPSGDTDLKLRLCIVGHCGLGGHRGTATTIRAISDSFFWKSMKEDISVFCNSCLHC